MCSSGPMTPLNRNIGRRPSIFRPLGHVPAIESLRLLLRSVMTANDPVPAFITADAPVAIKYVLTTILRRIEHC